MGFPARCPLCGGREVGRVGTTQFYCRDCCIEFAMSRRGPRLFRLEPDGTLVTIPPGETQPGAGGQHHRATGGAGIDGNVIDGVATIVEVAVDVAADLETRVAHRAR